MDLQAERWHRQIGDVRWLCTGADGIVGSARYVIVVGCRFSISYRSSMPSDSSDELLS